MKTKILRVNVIASLALAIFCSVAGTRANQGGLASTAGTVAIKTDPRALDTGTVDCATAQMTLAVNAQVFDDGTAAGSLQVTVVGGKSFLFGVTGGEATVEGRVVGDIILKLELIGDDGVPTGVNSYAIIRPDSASEPCRIYDIVGTQVNPSFHVEATTFISFKRNRGE